MFTGNNFGRNSSGFIALQDMNVNSTTNVTTPVFVYGIVLVWNHTYIQFRMPAWQGAGLALQVSVAGQSTSQLGDGTAVQWKYEPPVIYTMEPKTGPSSGRDAFGQPIMVCVLLHWMGCVSGCVSACARS